MKIVFLGDSLTQGTFGVSFVDKIAAVMPGHHFINAGVNGDTSLNLYRRVDKDVLAHQPDGAFVMVGINDAVSFSEPGSRAYYRFVKGVPGGHISPIAFRENLRALLGKLVVAQLRVWLALPPLEYRPEEVAALRKMNAYAQQVCQELNIPVLDLLARLTPEVVPQRPAINHWVYLRNLRVLLGRRHYNHLRDRGGFTYSFDGIHLTEQGAQAVADAIVPFLRVNGVT